MGQKIEEQDCGLRLAKPRKSRMDSTAKLTWMLVIAVGPVAKLIAPLL